MRGLKLQREKGQRGVGPVALSRVRGLKPGIAAGSLLAYRRTLTSAWIETYVVDDNMQERNVALSRVRGLKPTGIFHLDYAFLSHSHECVD